MRNKWPDFLFSVALRLLAGAVAGGIAGALLYVVLNLPAGKRPLLDWWLGGQPHPYRLYYWLGAWSLGGGIYVLWTRRGWRPPAGTKNPADLSVWKDLVASGWDGSGKTIVTKSVSIRTVGADGVQHTYSSMDEVPPEIRSKLEAMEKVAMQQKGDEFSVTERSETANSVTSTIIQRKKITVYKFKDEWGVEQTYHSLEELPPKIRAAMEEAENQLKRGESSS